MITVLPSDIVRRRHFGAGAIGLAFFLWGVQRQNARRVRAQLGGLGADEHADWVTLRRWRRAAAQGGLFHFVRPSPPEFDQRKRAERVAMTLASFAPPGVTDLAAQVFAGATRARAAARRAAASVRRVYGHDAAAMARAA